MWLQPPAKLPEPIGQPGRNYLAAGMRKTERSTPPSDLVAQREEKPGRERAKSNRGRQRRCCGTTLATPLRLQHSVAQGRQVETVPEIQRRAGVKERSQPALRH